MVFSKYLLYMTGTKLGAWNILMSKIITVPALMEVTVYGESIMGVQKRKRWAPIFEAIGNNHLLKLSVPFLEDHQPCGKKRDRRGGIESLKRKVTRGSSYLFSKHLERELKIRIESGLGKPLGSCQPETLFLFNLYSIKCQALSQTPEIKL